MTHAQFQIFIGDIDQNQFSQQIHDVANEAVAEQVDAEIAASQSRNNNVPMIPILGLKKIITRSVIGELQFT